MQTQLTLVSTHHRHTIPVHLNYDYQIENRIVKLCTREGSGKKFTTSLMPAALMASCSSACGS